MTVDPTVLPGLSLLAAELLALAAVGYVVARVVLGQTNGPMALAQGLVIGPALWGLLANFLLRILPGGLGALAAWVAALVLVTWLVRRAPHAWRMSPLGVAQFAAGTLAVFGVALAARQLLVIPDASLRLGLAASIQAGNWPPAIPWSPWQPVPYHYGDGLLAALLAPFSGPDLAFTTEVLGAYAWTCLAVITGTALKQRGGWVSLLTLTPLLLTAGAWTQSVHLVPDVLKLPFPTSLPEPGIRASLAEIYWPASEWPWSSPEPQASPPNIWKPFFSLGYALAFAVLERVTARRPPAAMPAVVTLAVLTGFLGLLEEALALTVLGVWIVVELARVVAARPPRIRAPAMALRGMTGPIAASLLLALGGGVITGLLAGSVGGNLEFRWIDDPNSRHLLGSVASLPGGIRVLGLGPLAVAAAALTLGRKDPLVLALAAGGGVFILAAVALQYGETPDLVRLDGHARNLALLALLVAVAARLSALRPRWRYASASLIVGVVTWPTLVAPVHNIGLGLERGVDLGNARPGREESGNETLGLGRTSMTPFASRAITAYVRDHTHVDARILSPLPAAMSIATGRPNASGFAGLLHLINKTGPEYEDAIRFLEPAAIQRLGFAYVHATDNWVASLPANAKRRLDDPELFELVISDGPDALYRIQPAFLRLATTPPRGSYEALRQAVPSSASVFIANTQQPLERFRLASVLRHAGLRGALGVSRLHLLMDIPTEPLGPLPPDVLVIARDLPLEVGVEAFSTIWWNDIYVAYATHPSYRPVATPPPRPKANFAVQLGDVRVADDSVAFTVTFLDAAPDLWTGQDWLVIEMEETAWQWLTRFENDGYVLTGPLWFPGQIIPNSATTTKHYEFDAAAGTLAAGDSASDLEPLPGSGEGLTPSVWSLAIRLQHEYLQAAVIPVLGISISASGDVAYTVYPGARESVVNPCPEWAEDSDSCRKLAMTQRAAPAH